MNMYMNEYYEMYMNIVNVTRTNISFHFPIFHCRSNHRAKESLDTRVDAIQECSGQSLCKTEVIRQGSAHFSEISSEGV